jgi:thiamine pyrophosphate-dependent acetolactate synthase large subunit-like protein
VADAPARGADHHGVFNNRSYNETRNRMWTRGKNQREKNSTCSATLGNPDVNFRQDRRGVRHQGRVVGDPNDLKPALQRAINATRDGKPTCSTCSSRRPGRAPT